MGVIKVIKCHPATCRSLPWDRISPEQEELLCSGLRDPWREGNVNYVVRSDFVSDPIGTQMAPWFGWTCYGYCHKKSVTATIIASRSE